MSREEEILEVLFPVALSFNARNKNHSMWRIDQECKKGMGRDTVSRMSIDRSTAERLSVSQNLAIATRVETEANINLILIWKDTTQTLGWYVLT